MRTVSARRRKWVTFGASPKKHIPSTGSKHVPRPLCWSSAPARLRLRISTAKEVDAMPICGDCVRAARRIASYVEEHE